MDPLLVSFLVGLLILGSSLVAIELDSSVAIAELAPGVFGKRQHHADFDKGA